MGRSFGEITIFHENHSFVRSLMLQYQAVNNEQHNVWFFFCSQSHSVFLFENMHIISWHIVFNEQFRGFCPDLHKHASKQIGIIRLQRITKAVMTIKNGLYIIYVCEHEQPKRMHNFSSIYTPIQYIRYKNIQIDSRLLVWFSLLITRCKRRNLIKSTPWKAVATEVENVPTRRY